jgi:HK97 family phage prohead protease
MARLTAMDYKTSTAPVSVSGGGISEGSGRIFGLASTYGGPPDLVGDIIERGAYAKTLRDKGRRRVLLWKHDDGEPIGEAILTDTEKGLELEGELAMDLPASRKAHYMARKGYGSLSIGYTPTRKRQGSGGVRYLEEIDLSEVSVVLYPANPAARITGAKEAEEAATIEALTALTADMKRYLADKRWERTKASIDARHERLVLKRGRAA